MPKVSPWHSKETIYFHDNDQCPEGRKIPPKDRLAGTGGKSQCVHCAILHSQQK